jgi:hypothetical protein
MLQNDLDGIGWNVLSADNEARYAPKGRSAAMYKLFGILTG